MSVIVCFVSLGPIGKKPGARHSYSDSPTIDRVRAKEVLALGGTTTNTVAADETVLILNAEASAILCAFGTTPDAQASSDSGVTTAGFPIGAGRDFAVSPPAGAKINVKAIA